MRIVISGTVGIGKSTTAKMLTEKLEKKGYKVNHLTEKTVVSPYLSHFYDEPEKWAFISQLDFLLERFKEWLINEKELKNNNDKNVITIYDRHFIDDYVFAELHSIKRNISEINSIVYQVVYKELLDKLNKFEAKPDYFFLLEAPLSTIVKRLKARGRDAEKNTDEDYWRELYESYYLKPKFKHHFSEYSKEVCSVDTENKEPKEVVEKILEIMKV